MIGRLLRRLLGGAAEAPASAVSIEAPQAIDGPQEVENIVPGSMIWVENGQTIAFGERAIVSPGLAQLLRERGQAR